MCYPYIIEVEIPARRLMQHLLSRFICYGKTVPGTLLDRVVSMGESPTKRASNSQHVTKTSVTNNDGLVDSINTFYLLIIVPSHIHMNIF